jgi:hypothetical protein
VKVMLLSLLVEEEGKRIEKTNSCISENIAHPCAVHSPDVSFAVHWWRVFSFFPGFFRIDIIGNNL